MKTMYTIHRIGTPRQAWRGHYSWYASEYWSNDDGWGHKSTADVFTPTERETLNLPDDGEWVEIYVNEPTERDN